jgi:FkbM family methyltransferase
LNKRGVILDSFFLLVRRIIPASTRFFLRNKIWNYKVKAGKVDSGYIVDLSENDGIWCASVNDSDFYILTIKRWALYAQGLQNSFEQLARAYGHNKYFTIQKGDVVVDIGANVGMFSRFADSCGSSVVYSMEADKDIFKILNKNIENYNIVANNYPIWNENTNLTFFHAMGSADSSIIEPEEFTYSSIQKAVTLDWALSKYSIDAIKVIKCDAEGAEPEVLNGARETLKKTMFIAFDCGAERKGETTIKECVKIIKEVGFEVLTRKIDDRVILVAKNKNLK